MKMCYCIHFDGREVCFCLPLAYDPFWWLPPRPDPDPWIIDSKLNRGTLRDIRGLAAIGGLAEELSPEFRDAFHNEIKRSVEKLKLPADVSIKVM